MAEIQKLQVMFNQANLKRQHQIFKLTKTFQQKLHYMDNKVRKQLKSFTLLSICGGEKNKYLIDPYFQQAFITLTLQQKIIYYDKIIHLVLEAQLKHRNQNQLNQSIHSLQNIFKTYGKNKIIAIQMNNSFLSWKQYIITVSGYKITSEKSLNIDLRNYLIRKSKNTEKKCYVLQAIHKSSPQTIRFSIKQQSQSNYIEMLSQIIDSASYDQICSMAFINQKNQTIFKKKLSISGQTVLQLKLNQTQKFVKQNSKQEKQQTIEFNIKKTISICEEIMKSIDQQDLEDDLKDFIQKQNQKQQIKNIQNHYTKQSKVQKNEISKAKICKNIFKIMLPDYNLNDLESFHNFQPIYNDNLNHLYIFKNLSNQRLFKMQVKVALSGQLVLQALQNVTLYKNWHSCVLESQQMLKISSQNCQIIYQKHTKYSKWYRQRDYLFLRHAFQCQKSYYLIDKSIQNTNFIPFNSITRGKINYCLFKITQSSINQTTITLEIDIDHCGLLNQSHAENLTLQYLKGFHKFQTYFKQSSSQSKLVQHFNRNWIVHQQLPFSLDKSSTLLLKQSDFGGAQSISKQYVTDQADIFFSIDDMDKQNSIHQLQEQEILQNNTKKSQMYSKQLACGRQQICEDYQDQLKLNEEGFIILPKYYVKNKYINECVGVAGSSNRIQRQYNDFVLKDDWRLLPEGGLQLINKKKIQAQNNVFSFILQTLKKNIFSGKGTLNISLPVQLFNSDSNLSRLCKGLSLGPLFLQKAVNSNNCIQRLKYCIMFGISNTLIYLDCQKPFNPILGQTYQGTIDGCPVYGEQISHHPPITSIYLVGRGYKVYANLQAKIRFHLNSADGANQGWFIIHFDNGQIVKFLPPAGQVSGLTMGARKFNLLGKSYYFDQANRLYCQLNFQDTSGFFSQNKWKYKDQISGQISKISQAYMSKLNQNLKQKKYPAKKDVQQKLSILSGRWPIQLKWDGNVYYRPNQHLPFEVINEKRPLSSNSFYRQDIMYRAQNDLSRSQVQKERLQVIQRADRKLRQTYEKKKNNKFED